MDEDVDEEEDEELDAVEDGQEDVVKYEKENEEAGRGGRRGFVVFATAVMILAAAAAAVCEKPSYYTTSHLIDIFCTEKVIFLGFIIKSTATPFWNRSKY